MFGFGSQGIMSGVLVGRSMSKHLALCVLALTAACICASGEDAAPLKLIQTVQMPGIKKGFDHLTPDVRGDRLFVAAEWNGTIEVYDMKTGRHLHSIAGLGRPHGILYRDDIDRIYVTDGDDDGGRVRIIDGKTYAPIKNIELLPDTDSIGYDPATKYLYVTNGGEDAKLSYSFVSIIDTTQDQKVGEIKINSDTLGGMRLETSSTRLFLDEPDKKSGKKMIGVVDRSKRSTIGSWLIPESKREGAMALDESHHRLFVGTIEGEIVVLDTGNGAEITRLPIGKGTDDMIYDARSKRIYAACDDGTVYVYLQATADHYKLLGHVTSAPGARTGRLVPEIDRYFAAVPARGETPAKLLIYQVQ